MAYLKNLEKMYKELGTLDKRRREILDAIHSNPAYIEQWINHNIAEMKKVFYKHTKTGHIGTISDIKVTVATGPKRPVKSEVGCNVTFNLYDEKNIQYIDKLEFFVNVSSRKEIEKQIINSKFAVITEREFLKEKKMLEKINETAEKKKKLEAELAKVKAQEAKIQKELATLGK